MPYIRYRRFDTIQSMSISILSNEQCIFPQIHQADESGLLAIGGDLTVERLVRAYRSGIFPWYNEGDPILWWSPDPRLVLFPQKLKVAKSMRPYFNQNKYRVTYNQDFKKVISFCQLLKREGQSGGTWITKEMMVAYIQLHKFGYAHSVEVWERDELVGGLYGIALGQCFFGESMFSKKSNASKFGFISLVKKLDRNGFKIIDCQQETAHLKRLGAEAISRVEFLSYLERFIGHATKEKWTNWKE